MLRKALILLGTIAVGLTLLPSSAGHFSRTESYVAGFLGDAELNLCDDNPSGMNIDQVCFSVQPGARYRIDISDLASGSSVGYLWVFRDASGGCVGDSPDPLEPCPNSGLHCGTGTYAAPAGAVQLTILMDGPVYGPLDCIVDGPGNSTGIATQGTVTATTMH